MYSVYFDSSLLDLLVISVFLCLSFPCRHCVHTAEPGQWVLQSLWGSLLGQRGCVPQLFVLPCSCHRRVAGVGSSFFCLDDSFPSSNHRSTERLGLEGTSKLPQLHPPAVGRDATHQMRLAEAPSSWALNTSRHGASTASLGTSLTCSTPPC